MNNPIYFLGVLAEQIRALRRVTDDIDDDVIQRRIVRIETTLSDLDASMLRYSSAMLEFDLAQSLAEQRAEKLGVNE